MSDGWFSDLAVFAVLFGVVVGGYQTYDQATTGQRHDWSAQTLWGHAASAFKSGDGGRPLGITWGVDQATKNREVFTSIAHVPQTTWRSSDGSGWNFTPIDVPFAHATIQAPAAAVHGVLRATFDDYAAPVEKTIDIPADQSVAVELNPSFNTKVRELKASTPATFTLTIKSTNGKTLYADSQQYHILPLDYFAWRMGQKDTTTYAAALITPNAPFVAEVLRDAANRTPWGAIIGYQEVHGSTHQEVVAEQLEAIWDTLQDRGFRYVNAPEAYTTSFAQHIKSPAATYQDGTGNCIESVLLLASIIEATGMNVDLVFKPGHVFLSVDNWDDGTTASIAFETTMLPSNSFSSAWNSGYYQYQHDDHFVVDVALARDNGVLPNPWL